MSHESRETFTSTSGTVLSMAGLAIGVGNIWRFPYMMGSFGGAAFLVVYLVIVLTFGIPGLIAEWALGRSTRRGPLGAFERAGVPGGRWWGYLLFFTIAMTAPYYSVVVSWVLYYAFLFLTSAPSDSPQRVFNSLMENLPAQWIFLVMTVGLATVSLYFGVKKGIERLSKLILPFFFAVFVLLMLRSLTLEGSGEGVSYYLVPRWDQFRPATVLAAMGQAFFSLGLGGTLMTIYGSYLRREENIPRIAVFTAVADTGASLLAGFIIVPAVFALGLDMASGPPLMFVVLPGVFQRLPLGSIFGFVFFLAVFLVALLSLVAAYEVMVGALIDAVGWTRARALAAVSIVQVIFAVPSTLSLDYLFYSDLIWGSTMQPVGGALAVVALAWFLGQARALEEIGRHSRLPVPRLLFYWTKYVMPAGILAALFYGWAA